MSVLPNQTNVNLDSYFFLKVDAQQIGTSSITANAVTSCNVYTGNLVAGNVSLSSVTTSTAIITGDVTALNVTATDTLTSYYTNTQYLTSYNGANIHNLLLANQIQGSNLVQFPLATLSSISTTSITLDGNTLDTAGSGSGASLLLNGQPIATISTLASSILTWSYYPALRDVDMNAFSLVGAGNVEGDTGTFYDINAANQITFATNLYGGTGNLNSLNVNTISTNLIKAAKVSTLTLEANTATVRGTLTANQADVTTINATNITTATLATTVGGTVSADNGVFKSLTATQGASISGGALNMNGQNVTGANNISGQSASIAANNQVGTLTTGNITAPVTNSGFPLYINSSGQNTNVIDYWTVNVDRGVDFSDTAVVNVNAGNGKYGIITLNAGAGYTLGGVGSPVGGSVVINAQGGSALGIAYGGTIALNAYSGTGTLSNATSKITMNAAGILSWAGVTVPIGSVTGYNYLHGDATVSITAGSVTAGTPPVGTVYIYAGNGTVVQNGFYTDLICPRNNGGDLYIQGYTYSGTQRNVRLSNVASLFMGAGTTLTAETIRVEKEIYFAQYPFGGINTSITDLHTLNFIPQIYDAGLGTSINNIQLVHFVDTQNSAIDGIKYITFTQNSGIFNLSTLQVSSINGSAFFPIPVIPSTFSNLIVSSLNANSISTNNLYAYNLIGVSSIDGYSIAQLVSSVSPPTPAPSTFNQLFTSSLVANTIQTINLSTISIQAQSLTGVSTIDGYTIAQFVSSVSPPTPAPSTFTQLYTSSLQANGITSPNYLQVQGQGILLQPDSNYNVNIVAKGIGNVFLESGLGGRVESYTSTVVFADFRYNTLFGQPYNPLQVATSSITASNISVINEQVSGTLTVGGVTVIPQQSNFPSVYASSLNANTISSGSLLTSNVILSSINGYSLSEIINQPVISTFLDLNTSNFGASSAGILYQNSVTLQVSSINGFNVSQFLSSSGQYPQGSTFNILFASSFQANAVSTGLLTVSTINGYNIGQLANPALSTVSTFAQLFTSSLVASNVQTSNLFASNVQSQLVSTIGVNAVTLNGVSSISGYSIAQLVSSVAPQPPIPSTVNQFYTSSLAANVITNYQNQGVDILAPGYINIHANTGVNIIGDQCNVTVTSSNLIENALYNYTNHTGNDWTVTAGCNISLNSSNTLSIYNTNTAPPVSPNDLYIIGQGNTTLAGQNNLNLSAVLDVNITGTTLYAQTSAVQFQVPSGAFAVNATNMPLVGTTAISLNTNSNINLTSASTINTTAVSTINTVPATWFSGDIRANTFNGAPLPTGGGGGNVTSTFTQLNTRILSNNPVYGNDLLIRAANAIVLNDTGGTTISLGGSFDVIGSATGVTNIQTATFNSYNDNISLTARSNITFTCLSTITTSAASTINTVPMTLFNGDITTTTHNTRILSNNPVYGNDLLIRAANAIVLNDTGETTISLGGSFDVIGAATGVTNIQTATFNSFNDNISLTARSNITFTCLSTITTSAASTINTIPMTLFNGDITTTTLWGHTIRNNPAVGGGLASDLLITADQNVRLDTVNGNVAVTTSGGYDFSVQTDAAQFQCAAFQVNSTDEVSLTGATFVSLTGATFVNATTNYNINLTSASTINTTAVSTINTVPATWFSGDIRATTFNGSPPPPLIQHGTVTMRSNVASSVVTLPISYATTNYGISLTAASNSPLAGLVFSAVADFSNSFTVYQNTTIGTAVNHIFYWITVG